MKIALFRQRKYHIFSERRIFRAAFELGCQVWFAQNRKYYTFRGFWSFVLPEILQVEDTPVNEMENSKASRRDNVLLKISNSAPIQDGWPTKASTTEIKASRCGLSMSWLLSVISLQHFLCWKFRNIYGIKHVFSYFFTFLLHLTYQPDLSVTFFE